MPACIDDLLRRLDSASLAPDAEVRQATRALVVVNDGPAHVGPFAVSFGAAFPVRATVGAQPVTVRDADGAVVPSRLVSSTLTTPADLPPDRRLWTLTLQFAAIDLPANGWRTYAATFGPSIESRTGDAAFWAELPVVALSVYETDCHPGDLPLTGIFAETTGPRTA